MSPPSYHHDYHHHRGHHQVAVVKQEDSTFTTTTTTTTATADMNTKEHNNHGGYGKALSSMSSSPSSLKINRDSYVIKKSPSRSVVGSPSTPLNKPQYNRQQHRGPVIIYTHSPKIIHTNPRDFRALVQKLTGMSSIDDAAASSLDACADASAGVRTVAIPNEGPHLGQHWLPEHKTVKCSGSPDNNNNNNNNNSTDESSSSVVTDENHSSNSTNTGDVMGQLNPCVGPVWFSTPPAPPDLSLFMNNSLDPMYCSGDMSLYEYMDFNVPYNQIT